MGAVGRGAGNATDVHPGRGIGRRRRGRLKPGGPTPAGRTPAASKTLINGDGIRRRRIPLGDDVPGAGTHEHHDESVGDQDALGPKGCPPASSRSTF